ncbi:GAF domain-containing protein [Natronolimnohabitans sp. A-GB9]|uniref:GAF domain-containing protein n=1 Tax=Natronolimnohabitans sp. A-GB9 TaxID=3069757 RepID=UPI0027B0ECFC|nr:GAF domain-containing protein [Natronolimnohabitans sp. A-GB9]MDQ2050244.1 GAF domain-containing protein [Natronolimnohabitans sp. A-GB9]
MCYLAATPAAAREGATALEDAPSGPKLAVQPLSIDAVDDHRDWLATPDCVVFAATPTTAAGARLLEVVDACEATPLVLFSAASYPPRAARSTDGIDGYVRRDTDDAVAHLADEIEWVCARDESRNESEPGPAIPGGSGLEPDETVTEAEQPSATEAGRPSDAIETSGSTTSVDPRSAALLETVPDLFACDGRDELAERLVTAAADALETDYCWLSRHSNGKSTLLAATDAVSDTDLVAVGGVIDEVCRTGEPLWIDGRSDDRLTTSLGGLQSLCCVPIGDGGHLCVASEAPAAFDDRDRESLVAWGRVGDATLERLETEPTRPDDHGRHAAERDRMQVPSAVPEPALCYELVDGEPVVRDVNDTFATTFGTEPDAVVGESVRERTGPPGLEGRQGTLCETLQTRKRRQFVTRRGTISGVREFRLTVTPLEASSDTDERAHARWGVVRYSDVTETRRQAREAAAAQKRLETIADTLEDDVRRSLNVARGYLELTAATGDIDHLSVVETTQHDLCERVDELVAIARREINGPEPVAAHDVARRAWVAVDTGDARLETGANVVLEADKTRLRTLFEHLLGAIVERLSTGEGNRPETGDPTITVEATDDGFVVSGRPTGDDGPWARREPSTEPDPDRVSVADGSDVGPRLEAVDRIAEAHGWDVRLEETDGPTVVVSGVEPIDVGRDSEVESIGSVDPGTDRRILLSDRKKRIRDG